LGSQAHGVTAASYPPGTSGARLENLDYGPGLISRLGPKMGLNRRAT
jgi:hypothetical protein